MTTDQHTNTDEYLAKLHATVADPRQLMASACQRCGYAFAYRVWPDRGEDALAAFLNGLAELSDLVGTAVFGLWRLDVPITPPIGEPLDADAPVQLWRANDRVLLATTTMLEAARMAAQHSCAALN